MLEIANAKQAVEGLGVQQSILLKKSNLSQTYVSFPNRGAICLSEGGLNRLILRSDKPEARPFQDWVTGTVLPAIRKDGAYINGEEKLVSGKMDEDAFVLKAMNILQSKVGRLWFGKFISI